MRTIKAKAAVLFGGKVVVYDKDLPPSIHPADIADGPLDAECAGAVQKGLQKIIPVHWRR